MNASTPAAPPQPDTPGHLRRIFTLLVLYRWLSLAPPVVLLLVDAASRGDAVLLSVLAAAAASNLLITLIPGWLNRTLRRWPLVLGFDLVFCASLIAFSGGARSPYYLYSLSPILAAAFFFHVRGALYAAGAFTALFAGALVSAGAAPDWITVAAQVVGFFLIGGVFGVQPALLARLGTAQAELERAHRDLEVIHELTVSLQSAVDVSEVEERVLQAVTGDLGFARAAVALVDQNEGVITSWLGKSRDGKPMFAGGLPLPASVPLSPAEGAIAQCLLDGAARMAARDLRTSNQAVNRHLGPGPFHVFPMLLREHPVGVMLVDASEAGDPARLRSLESIASQAAVAMGTTLLCIDRAQRLAVQEERIRIAREIHDTVTQSLFGIVYSLDACIKLLPRQPDTVRAELGHILALAENTRAEVRQSILDIWPSELTADQFVADLRRYVREACRANNLDFEISLRGEFGALSPRTRRSLYRIAQEALTNIDRHAGASLARVCLDVADGQVMLSVRDDGRGFDPAVALARERNRERFGLLGIRDRAASLGGTTDFVSQPGAGATLLVSIPLKNGG